MVNCVDTHNHRVSSLRESHSVKVSVNFHIHLLQNVACNCKGLASSFGCFSEHKLGWNRKFAVDDRLDVMFVVGRRSQNQDNFVPFAGHVFQLLDEIIFSV